MKCTTCGANLPNGALFCTTCGSKVSPPAAAPSGIACAQCGTTIPAGMKFCTTCGAPAPQPAPAQTQQGGFQSPGYAAVPYPGKSASVACPVCGKTIPEGYVFCTGCGTPVGSAAPTPPAAEPPVICWNCEAVVPAGMRFCTNCGADMNDVPYAEEDYDEPEPARKKSHTGLWITLICVLLALIGAVAVLFFTGTLDDLLGIDREDTEESDTADNEDEDEDDQEDSDKKDSSSEDKDKDKEKKSEDQEKDDNEDEDEKEEEPEESPEPEPDYLLPDSNTRYLTEADLQDLSWRELCLARNEIFARHGLKFNTPEIREYFESKDWYEGRYTEVTLSDTETANVNLIVKYEKDHFNGSYY